MLCSTHGRESKECERLSIAHGVERKCDHERDSASLVSVSLALASAPAVAFESPAQAPATVVLASPTSPASQPPSTAAVAAVASPPSQPPSTAAAVLASPPPPVPIDPLPPPPPQSLDKQVADGKGLCIAHGGTSDNPEIVQAHADLEKYSKQEKPTEWALAHSTLAAVFTAQADASPGLNHFAEKSIEHTKKALEIFTKDFEDGLQFANHFNNLASLYFNRVAGNRADNVAEALRCCYIALQVFKRMKDCNSIRLSVRVPADIPIATILSQLHSLLAQIWQSKELTTGTPAGNRDWAIRHRLAALQHYSKADKSMEWAMCQLDLGCAYQERINGSKKSNVTAGIKHWRNAMQIVTQTEFPDKYARIQSLIAQQLDKLEIE